jgi:hydrogenase maturation protease
MTAPVLVLGWGNRSRGDDALGPLCVERLGAAWPGRAQLELLDDYQLMVEHALDLAGRRHVLFVDASLQAPAPFEAGPVQAARDASHSTHAMSPQALLQVYVELHREVPPPCTGRRPGSQRDCNSRPMPEGPPRAPCPRDNPIEATHDEYRSDARHHPAHLCPGPGRRARQPAAATDRPPRQAGRALRGHHAHH